MIIPEKFPIKIWAEEDRPREKLLLKGRQSLTDAELLAILIASGSATESALDLAKRILHVQNEDLHKLAKLSVKDLMRFKGIGEAKAIAILAALELGRRRKDLPDKPLDKILSSQDAFTLLRNAFLDLNHERFVVLFLNRANGVIHQQELSNGGVTGTVVDPKLIFKLALEQLAVNLILAHNHPSGNNLPSVPDKTLTQKLQKAGALLDIGIIDHLIIAGNTYFSFADNGLL